MANWKDFVDPDARGGRYLPWKEVARATGLSRTTAWRLQKRDDFPAPYAISPGRVGYREDEVEAWRVSRDPSAARPRGAVRQPRPGVAPDPPAAASTREAAQDRRESAEAHRAAAERPGIASAPSKKPRLQPPARGAGRTRRRSQHAQAIAQQMRFDF